MLWVFEGRGSGRTGAGFEAVSGAGQGLDQAWVFGDWEKSEGCKIEIQAAEEAGVPVVDKERNA